MVRVIFKDANLRRFILDVAQTDSVEAIKLTISSTINIPPHKQRLVYQGRELLDQELVSDCLSEDSVVYVLTHNNTRELSATNPIDALIGDNNLIKMTLESNSYLKNICQDNPEIGRAVNDLISDPQTLIQAAKAAANPAVARELARTTDRAVQNVEAIPGGFQALYNLHNKLQDPLWNAASSVFNDESPVKAKIYSDDRLAPLEAQPLPNPWKQSTGVGFEAPSHVPRLPHGMVPLI